MKEYKCFICKKILKNAKGLGIHVAQFHKKSVKAYYDKFLRKKGEGRCKICSKGTSFYTVDKGYKKYCSDICASKDLILKEKRRQTCIEKYGGPSPANSINIQKKMQQANIKKYGVKNSFQSDIIKEQIKTIKKIKYGSEYYSNQEKARKTNEERYGHKVGFCSNQAKEKIKLTSLEKYGTECPMKSDRVKKNLSDSIYVIYGVRWPTLLKQNIESRMRAQYSKSHQKLFRVLEKMGSFEKEALIEDTQYIVDIYNSSKKIIIECQGDYWHCNPKKYSPDFYHKQMKKQLKKSGLKMNLEKKN